MLRIEPIYNSASTRLDSIIHESKLHCSHPFREKYQKYIIFKGLIEQLVSKHFHLRRYVHVIEDIQITGMLAITIFTHAIFHNYTNSLVTDCGYTCYYLMSDSFNFVKMFVEYVLAYKIRSLEFLPTQRTEILVLCQLL